MVKLSNWFYIFFLYINEYHSDMAIHKTQAGKPPSDLWIH